MDEFQQYPQMMYRDGDAGLAVIVNSDEERAALGDAFTDAPVARNEGDEPAAVTTKRRRKAADPDPAPPADPVDPAPPAA